jgi:hypothetical protein
MLIFCANETADSRKKQQQKKVFLRNIGFCKSIQRKETVFKLAKIYL